MKNISKFLMIPLLSAGILLSCNSDNKGKNKEEKGKKEHHRKGHERDHKGEHKGPPNGHSPEETRSLEEIGGYKIGDVAADFELKNIDGKMVSLAQYKNAKGYVVVFTCNGCPFSKLYEDRLIDLHNKFESKGYPVIAINPNVNESNEQESYAAMQARAKEKSFPFAYLADVDYSIFPKYGAARTPHVFLLDADKKVQYIGAIDDNAKKPEEVTKRYVENAIASLEEGAKPDPNFTKAIGCPVKGGKAPRSKK